jgi:hypothetical protein
VLKALNLYQLLAIKNTQVDQIKLGTDLNHSQFRYCNTWLFWPSFACCQITMETDQGEKRVTFARYLADRTEELLHCVRPGAPCAPIPWDSTDLARRWFLPYLRGQTREELKRLVEDDLKFMLEQAELHQPKPEA